MLFIAADHAGYTKKEYLKKYFEAHGISFQDLGAHTLDRDDDYPDYAKKLAYEVKKNQLNKGILICGSGQGVCITANKVHGIRAALAWNSQSARASRTDDDVNVLCLAARLLSNKEMEKIVLAWLKTPFSKKTRHIRRIQNIEK
ncbi:RpiB/LacA/LacB family sugar-phosphate isomerase [Candidatus Uhrbacteria bacterium]|nr:RpiB/LacA/LacB family sugar-phosphate isomerase [Candidatus Uhrbacteria bacterium]